MITFLNEKWLVKEDWEIFTFTWSTIFETIIFKWNMNVIYKWAWFTQNRYHLIKEQCAFHDYPLEWEVGVKYELSKYRKIPEKSPSMYEPLQI